ncbi:MAG: hypothetical protein EpisKO_06020 [Epibacterium sp.]
MSHHEGEIRMASGRLAMPRLTHLRPHNPNCPIHLRRICGTCGGFPASASMRAEGQHCARLQVTVNGLWCAAGCKLWTRKGAAPVAPETKQ